MFGGWKRLDAWLAAALLLTAPVAAKADFAAFGMVYNSGSVNLREGPSLDGARLGSYARGTWVTINQDLGEWYYVMGPDGKLGYMSKQYVDINYDNIGTVGIVTNPEGTHFLNLRASASYSAKVLGIYYNGVPCILLGVENEWFHVRVNGVEGYFRSEFVQPQTLVYSEKVATIVTPNGKAVNMRSGPDTSYPIAHQFQNGQYVMVLKQGKDWWRVSCEGYVGYMDAAFLKDGVWTPDGTNSVLAEQSAKPLPNGTPAPGKPVVTPVPPSAVAYAVVTNPKQKQVLNMRTEPDTTASVIAQYANGAQLLVLKQGVEWCLVQNSNGEIGYMMTDFLTLYQLPEVPTARVNHPQQSYVYLRSMASKNGGSVMARVPHGASVTVMIPGDTWSKVRYNGQTGYMMTSFLQ